MTRVYLICLRRNDGQLPKVEKTWGDRWYYEPEEAKQALAELEEPYCRHFGVYSALIEIESEVS